jgi:hypothetical protein
LQKTLMTGLASLVLCLLFISLFSTKKEWEKFFFPPWLF